MRLITKLIIALTAAALLILGLHAVFRVRRELRLFDADMRRDNAVIGRVLARAIGDAWHAGGEPAAAAILRDTDLTAHHLRVRWVWFDGPQDRPRLDPRSQAAARDGTLVTQRFAGEHGVELITLVAITVPDGRVGGLELAEPLRDRDRYIRATIVESLLSTAALIGALAGASLLIGVIFIGRPTRALVAKARRIAGGDLGGPLAMAQRDELGDLARELNGMSDQLAAARDRAAAAVEARLAAVTQLRHADRLSTVGRLASGVAHELGTPLNVVGGRAQMIASGELDGSDVVASARIIHEQAKRMTAIVRQLLDFARRGAPSHERVELRQVATRCQALIAATAHKKGVALVVDDGGGEVAAWGDDGQLQQAVLNLIVNAIHATPSNGRVEISAAEVDATPPADHGGPAGRWARLRVADTGAGIDEATLARIFEPFFTTKGVGEGTGLGLSVTYGIVHDAGGWIEVSSQPGEGSVFSLLLPMAA